MAKLPSHCWQHYIAPDYFPFSPFNQAGKILKEFLQGKENISKTILQSDVSLQEKDKEKAGKGVNKLPDDAGTVTSHLMM